MCQLGKMNQLALVSITEIFPIKKTAESFFHLSSLVDQMLSNKKFYLQNMKIKYQDSSKRFQNHGN